MTESEAIEKLRAYHKCQRLQVKGIYEDCNEKLCDNCDLCYAQGNTGEHIESVKVAIKALEKQIPKKPILKNGESGSFVDYEDGHGEYKVTEWQDWVCPICGWFVGQRYNWSQNHSHDQRKCNYCNECGQKLDWSDVD